jgi:poly-gamma-glutamate capsule biosynthesis protein CapA/YwtB (metallophosphatase superfamily)
MGLPPKNGRALFLQVAEQLQEPDIMAGNLEGTFGSGGKSKSDETGNKGTFSFQAPPAYAESLAWAGFDVMNMANNHAYDYRDPGLASTKKALAAQGIDHTGMSGQITIREANGVRVAFIGTSPYWWSQSLNNIKDTAWLVARAKKKADVVVVIMHAGAEGPDKTATPKGVEMAFGEARGNPRAFSHAMIDAGASLVVGSGPHVVRGIERYKGKLIAYSLGNFAGWSNFSLAGKSALSGLLTVRIDRNGEVLGGQLLPLVLRDPGVPEVDPSGKTLKLVTTLSKQDFKDTFALDAKGDFGPGR